MAKNEFGNGKPCMWLGMNFKKCMWEHAVKTIDKLEIDMLESKGYERVVRENKSTGESVVKYCKCWPSVTGYLTGLKIDNGPFGQNLVIKLEDETEVNFIQLPLWSQGNSMNAYAMDFARHHGNIPLDEQITIGVNRKLENERGGKVQILTLTYAERRGKMGEELMQRSIKKEDLPLVQKYTRAGKDFYDSKERDNYMVNVLEKFIEHVNDNKIDVPLKRTKKEAEAESAARYVPEEAPRQSSIETPKETKQETYKSSPQQENVIDDLPF